MTRKIHIIAHHLEVVKFDRATFAVSGSLLHLISSHLLLLLELLLLFGRLCCQVWRVKGRGLVRGVAEWAWPSLHLQDEGTVETREIFDLQECSSQCPHWRGRRERKITGIASIQNVACTLLCQLKPTQLKPTQLHLGLPQGCTWKQNHTHKY